MKRQYFLLFLAIFLPFISCKKNEKNTTPEKQVDRKPMLTNIGTNIIVPSYQLFQVKATSFDSMLAVFNTAPDAAKLDQLQDAFKELYKTWQMCSPFELGTAEQIFLNINTNTFPTDASKINGNIASGSYNLNAASNLSAKGLPAIDYLLFGSDDATILSLFTTDSKAAAMKQYASALSAEIKTNIASVVNAWTSGYLTSFTNADGTDVGSSVGQLVNKMDYDLEILKNNKLGIPLGKQSMGNIFPEKTEAYYSGISAQLAMLQLQAMENVYLGKSAQGDGQGFDDYLVQIDAKYNGGSLNDTIKHQFVAAIDKIKVVADPLSASIQNNATDANAAYVEIQKLLVLLKTDMPSAMGILITYTDNDGD